MYTYTCIYMYILHNRLLFVLMRLCTVTGSPCEAVGVPVSSAAGTRSAAVVGMRSPPVTSDNRFAWQSRSGKVIICSISSRVRLGQNKMVEHLDFHWPGPI